ncbi:hypothetical protein PMAYCL1PPCAC_23332, partial [Pristionchus mayeri]
VAAPLAPFDGGGHVLEGVAGGGGGGRAGGVGVSPAAAAGGAVSCCVFSAERLFRCFDPYEYDFLSASLSPSFSSFFS